MTDRIAPNPHSPHATADPRYRHLLPSLFGKPKPGVLIPTGCHRMAVVPDEPPRVILPGAGFPDGICPACITAWQAETAGHEYPDDRPVSDCRECDSPTRHDGLCALCRQENHDEWRAQQVAAPEVTP